jgi:hypothetical protein
MTRFGYRIRRIISTPSLSLPLQCYIGTNSIANATASMHVDDCTESFMLVNVYMSINIVYNILIIMILKVLLLLLLLLLLLTSSSS